MDRVTSAMLLLDLVSLQDEVNIRSPFIVVTHSPSRFEKFPRMSSPVQQSHRLPLERLDEDIELFILLAFDGIDSFLTIVFGSERCSVDIFGGYADYPSKIHVPFGRCDSQIPFMPAILAGGFVVIHGIYPISLTLPFNC